MRLQGDIFAEFINGTDEIVVPSDMISFSLIDSIHSLYSRASVSLKDRNGLISEYLLSTPGNILKIRFGNTNFPLDVLEAKYILNKEILEEGYDESPESLGGELSLNFKHEWMNYQKAESRSFQDSINNLVTIFTSEYPFRMKIIEPAGGFTYWYQGMRTKAKMITEDFLEKAWNSSSKGTPFFAFIDSSNTFNFRTYASMFGSSNLADADYNFFKNSADTSINTIISIQRWSETFEETQSNYKKALRYIDENFSITASDIDSENHFLKNPSDTLPVTNLKSYPVKFIARYLEDSNSDLEKGLINNSMRDSLFKERFMIIVPLNTKLISGKTINMTIPVSATEETSFSNRYSGKYIIEMSEHVWDGEGAAAVSKLLISRKYAQIPERYQLRRFMP